MYIQYIYMHIVIDKNLPNAIGKQLTTISSDEEMFNLAAPIYNNPCSRTDSSSEFSTTEIMALARRERKDAGR